MGPKGPEPGRRTPRRSAPSPASMTHGRRSPARDLGELAGPRRPSARRPVRGRVPGAPRRARDASGSATSTGPWSPPRCSPTTSRAGRYEAALDERSPRRIDHARRLRHRVARRPRPRRVGRRRGRRLEHRRRRARRRSRPWCLSWARVAADGVPVLELTGCAERSATSWRSTASRSPCPRAPSSGSSVPTAPARPPRCASPSACSTPDAGEVRWRGEPVDADDSPPFRLHARGTRPLPEDAGARSARSYLARLHGLARPTPARRARRDDRVLGVADRAARPRRGALARQPATRAAGGRPRPRARTCWCSTSRSRASTRSGSTCSRGCCAARPRTTGCRWCSRAISSISSSGSATRSC